MEHKYTHLITPFALSAYGHEIPGYCPNHPVVISLPLNLYQTDPEKRRDTQVLLQSYYDALATEGRVGVDVELVLDHYPEQEAAVIALVEDLNRLELPFKVTRRSYDHYGDDARDLLQNHNLVTVVGEDEWAGLANSIKAFNAEMAKVAPRVIYNVEIPVSGYARVIR